MKLRRVRIPLLAVAALAGGSLWLWAQNPPAGGNPAFKDGGYAATLDKLKIPHPTIRARMPAVDLANWPRDRAVNGPAPTRVTGGSAGLSPNDWPGVKRASFEQLQKLDVLRQQSGLFVVGDLIPLQLPEILKDKGLTLEKDGKLHDQNGELAVAFTTGEVYLVKGTAPRTSSLARPNALGRFLSSLADAFSPAAAEAASPFPFRCYAFTPWALYHGGFHRWYEADTWVDAYGPDGGGGCSGGSPHTRIDYLQARAAVSGGGHLSWCFTCEHGHAHDEWDVGWFWPAHGIPITSHSGVWADGSFSFSRTASLSW